MAQGKDFSAYARNPEIWMHAARRNLAVAELLMGLYLDRLRAAAKPDFYLNAGCFYAGYLHAGLAIENAAKAVLISRNPAIVEEGRLIIKKFGGRTGHELLDPVESILGSLTEEERRFLTKLEGFVWAGRYAVPTKADELSQEKRSIRSITTFDERAMLRSLFNRLCQKIEDNSTAT